MHISKFVIQNFKSIKDLTISFNRDINIFTGPNNSGKTTILEAIALWHECFNKLIRKAGKSRGNYRKDDFILGTTIDKYFPFDQINSVRSPNFEDIFHNRDRKNRISLKAEIENDKKELIEIGFSIAPSSANYVIQLIDYTKYNFRVFNEFFTNLPDCIGLYYGTPVSSIDQVENFVTSPQISEAIHTRRSVAVLRNRLYNLYRDIDSSLFPKFLNDLSFVLFNNTRKILITTNSDIQRDQRVTFNFQIGNDAVEKDIGLLGSGSLQIIEILLNLYQPGEPRKDMNLVLLDEPDSHIHRDIQKRLFGILSNFSTKNQLFISTHNESLIRSAEIEHLFHLDINTSGNLQSISVNGKRTGIPHFKGIFPSKITPIIRALNSGTALDIVSALECDKLVFVEGEDDAVVLDTLLEKINIRKNNYMFWVMGGISRILKDITSYRTVFEQIKNSSTLWDKCSLVFDKDHLSNEHLINLVGAFSTTLHLPSYATSAYTFESSLLTELEKFAKLIQRWLELENKKLYDLDTMLTELTTAYENIEPVLRARYSPSHISELGSQYSANILQVDSIFPNQKIIHLKQTDIALYLEKYITDCFVMKEYYKLMTKGDVEIVLNEVLKNYGQSFSIEVDFLKLIKLIDRSIWFVEWDFLYKL